MKFACDTNVFVDVLRDAEAEDAFGRFLSLYSHVTYLSAVVVLELRAGARTAEQRRLLDRSIIAPFEARGRVFVPSAAAFSRAGDLLSQLASREDWRASAQPSLANDVLLAASCRESGITLITRDRDFTRIRERLRGLQFVAPWPGV